MPDFNTVPAVNVAYFFNMRHILMCAGFYVVVQIYSAPNFISHASRFTRAGFLIITRRTFNCQVGPPLGMSSDPQSKVSSGAGHA